MSSTKDGKHEGITGRQKSVPYEHYGLVSVLGVVLVAVGGFGNCGSHWWSGSHVLTLSSHSLFVWVIPASPQTHWLIWWVIRAGFRSPAAGAAGDPVRDAGPSAAARPLVRRPETFDPGLWWEGLGHDWDGGFPSQHWTVVSCWASVCVCECLTVNTAMLPRYTYICVFV